MNELNYLYEQVYAKNINNHFNIVKLVKKGISGTPLFVTVSELLSKSNILHTNIASKLSLLGVEYLELAKKEQDAEFLKKLGGTISKTYGDLFDVDKNNLLPLENYFSFYLNFISYYWNLYSDVLDRKLLKYVSVRFLYLYARLVHDSAYDVSSSREAEYVHQVLIENQIPLTNDIYHCLLVIYAHTGKQDLCENLFNTIINSSNDNMNDMNDSNDMNNINLNNINDMNNNMNNMNNSNNSNNSNNNSNNIYDSKRTIYQSMVNAYSIMGNFEKALYYATQVKMNIEVLNALLKSVATLCLPNMRNLNDEDYILSCLQKTIQLFADHSIQYDGITLNTLINIYGLLGKLPYMIKHFQMLVDNINFKEYVNAITFTTVIRHLCMNDHFDSALDMFNRMKELNIKPTRVTYKVLLEGMILTGKDCLPMIMQNMKYDNISMDDHLVGSIVLYYASRTRNEQQLMDILSVVDRHKSEYTPKVYEHLVLFYCKINNFSRARFLIYEMLERGVTPTMRTFTHFITFLHTHMDSFDLLHILLPIEQDIVNYITQRKKGELNSLSNTIFDGKDLGIGLSLLQIMLQKVDFTQLQTKIEHLSRDHYLNKNVSYILSGLIKTDPNANVKDFIDNLIYLFESCGCSPFASTNALFLHVISELKGPFEMKQFYLEMKRNNLILDIRSFNLYLEALLNTEGSNSMWKYFNTCQTSTEIIKINPDIDTLHILIRSIRDFNDMEFILSKYRQFIDSTRYLSPKLSKQKTSKNSPQLKEEIISSILDAIESKESLINSNQTFARIEQMKDYLQKALFSFIE
ncbi:predicted protein [Naegleria gruberi]|uniref:Predicted protein n=1 Tax=Naegleria gruberi TaxID=5762 RepID=D2VXP1_NAEGR|nr:uncharacterized protein NAEGRDRAFT_81622 [Naegleria gruberi]EFC38326.1 predicted protein [Naegleria gruberi]|eukprot:XP_002671070.1 predicted protein [Naegleria gruberi strain NEG-M]